MTWTWQSWQLAAGNDLAYPLPAERRRAGSALVSWYLGHVHTAASTDRVVCRAFFDVVNLLAPLGALVRPAILARVARHVVEGAQPTAS